MDKVCSGGQQQMRVLAMTMILAVLGGCSDPVADAERRWEIVQNVGSPQDKCDAARALAAAQLEAKKEWEFRVAKSRADITCSSARYDAVYGSGDASMTADNLEAEADNAAGALNALTPASAKSKASVPTETAHDQEDPNDLVSRVADGTLDMCYKDYCPCDGEQGGPDMPLCDQLEQGIQPPVDLMIAGRAMREGRRQLEASGY